MSVSASAVRRPDCIAACSAAMVVSSTLKPAPRAGFKVMRGTILSRRGAPRVTTDPLFFRDLSYVLIAAVAGGFAARLLRQPLIVGFVLAGMVIGPFTPGPRVSDLHTFELFAEIGVVLLMFSIGIEFSLQDLLRVKWVAVVGGPLGIALSIALAMAVGTALGWSLL